MSKEELLKERFIVIADYPGNNRMEGEIIPSPTDSYTQDEIDILIFTCKKFPKIFKELEWWQERNIDDLPMYLKEIDNDTFYKVTRYSINGEAPCFFTGETEKRGKWKGMETPFNLRAMIPATEQEYLDYLKN